MAIIETVVSQHAEEAAFLWLLRDAAVWAPHYNLKELADLDERVEAHIDGLRIAGDEGWPFLQEGLAYEENGEIFAAAVLALEGDDPRRREEVYSVVADQPETSRGLISALGWVSREKFEDRVPEFVRSASAFWRRIGVAGCAAHHMPTGPWLDDALADPDPELRSRAIRTVGELGDTARLSQVLNGLGAPEEQVRFWSAWSSVLLGDRRAGLEALTAAIASDTDDSDRALQLAARAMPINQARVWLTDPQSGPKNQRLAIVACGAMGNPRFAPWLIEQMADPEHARIAGEAFTMITGADFSEDPLEGDWPEGFEAGPNDNPEDEDVAMDADEDLPWPNLAGVRDWWKAHESNFQGRVRYLLGEPITVAHCRQVLMQGSQRQRHAAALELSLMQPETALFETRAPGKRQQSVLASLA